MTSRLAYIKDVCACLEEFAPLALQETYDNSGLLVGDPEAEVSGILITLDITEATIDEAISKGLNLIVAHHPIIFKPLSKIVGRSLSERCVIKAIQNNIALYAAHTNLDSVYNGVSKALADKLNLQDLAILSPRKAILQKLVSYVPIQAYEEVVRAVTEAGAGKYGNYDQCVYRQEGLGSFRPLKGANPTVGEIGVLHQEKEYRLEVLISSYNQSKILKALIKAHPYEEPVFDILALENESLSLGYGLVGYLNKPLPELEFLSLLKNLDGVELVKHSTLRQKKIHKVALSGGSGSSMLNHALSVQADAFVSSEFKYNQYLDHSDQLLLADIGHFESEQFTKQLFLEILQKKISKFAICFAETSLNPVKYYK